MPVTVYIPSALREFTDGRPTVKVEHAQGTVADALHSLCALHPGVRDRLLNEQGQLRQHINVFIGNENIRYTGGLASPLPNGSEVSIVPAVSGGCS